MNQVAAGAAHISKKRLVVFLGVAALVGLLALIASVHLGLLFVHSGGPGLWLAIFLAPSYWYLDWNGVKPPFDVVAMLAAQFVYWAWGVFAVRALASRLRGKA